MKNIPIPEKDLDDACRAFIHLTDSPIIADWLQEPAQRSLLNKILDDYAQLHCFFAKYSEVYSK